MIDKRVFADQMQRLALLYPGAAILPETIEEYYRILGPMMMTEDFEAACDRIRVSAGDEFFPRPGRILAAAAENDGGVVTALGEWVEAIKPSSWRYAPGGTYCDYRFSDRGRWAWEAMGGDARMRNLEDGDVDFRRAEFVRLYREATIEAIAAANWLRDQRKAGLTSGDAIDEIGGRARRAINERSLPPGEGQ